jgi:hypothetical protein
MKAWIQRKLRSEGKKLPDNYNQLRQLVRDSWDAVGEDGLAKLIESMPARCQAVIDARGYYTKY